MYGTVLSPGLALNVPPQSDEARRGRLAPTMRWSITPEKPDGVGGVTSDQPEVTPFVTADPLPCRLCHLVTSF
jgi:hypothetical protein